MCGWKVIFSIHPLSRLILASTIVSRMTGVADSVVSSIFQMLEIGHFSSPLMMAQNCGLTAKA
jgi:hypothetical protein